MESEIQEWNGAGPEGVQAIGSPPAQGDRPLRRRKIRVEVEVPEALMAEFDLMVQEVLAGPRTRLTALEQEFKAIETRGLTGLGVVHRSICAHPGTGQTRRLVRFLVGLYDGASFPFDLSELRGLDTALANACLDYLNYDRLALANVDQHLPAGERVLEAWIHQYGWVSQPLELQRAWAMGARVTGRIGDLTPLVEQLESRTRRVFADAHGAERHARLCQCLERLYGALELARLLEQGALARWIETHIDAVRREIEAD